MVVPLTHGLSLPRADATHHLAVSNIPGPDLLRADGNHQLEDILWANVPDRRLRVGR